MGLLDRRRRPRRSPASLRVATGEVASVRRYDLNSDKDVAALARSQTEWQSAVWFYSDAVGELIDSRRFIENAFRRVRLYAGFVRDPDAEPVPVLQARRGAEERGDAADESKRPADAFLDEKWAREAHDVVESFRANDGGQAKLMGRLGVNIFLVGETYIVNRVVSPTEVDADGLVLNEARTDWEVRSVDEVRESRAVQGRLELIDAPGQQAGVVLEPNAFVERVWRPHPRWSSWADSNCRAAVGVLEELDLLAKLARGSIRSRLVAGLALVPDELDFADPDQERTGQQTTKFDRDLEEAFASAITDEADANTVAPLALRGRADALKEFRVVEFPRRYAKEDREQYEQAVRRLGQTIELPVDRMAGMADVNHWTAWQIDEETYRAHVEPLVGVGTEALTYGLLRPMLADMGCPADVLNRLVVAADASMLVRRPDRGQVATEGHGLGVLSDDAWRRANGFSDDDAPDEVEQIRRLAFSAGLDQAATVKILGALDLLPEDVAAALAEMPETVDQGTGVERVPPTPEESAGRPATDPAPATSRERDAVAASAAPTPLDSLSLADRLLSERVLTAADAAVSRALDRAGARLRTRAQKRQTSREALVAAGDVPNAAVGRALGEAATAALASSDVLFDGAFDDLRPQWDAWVDGVQQTALGSLRANGADVSDEEWRELREQQERDRDDAWAWLAAALALAAVDLFSRAGNVEDPGVGEFDGTVLVSPAIVREALARAGGTLPTVDVGGGVAALLGGPVGGVATGDLLRRAFAAHGLLWSGFRWDYGDASLRQRPYEPHRALSGVVVGSWSDDRLANATDWPRVGSLYPGDHRHCKCSFTPLIAPPEG